MGYVLSVMEASLCLLTLLDWGYGLDVNREQQEQIAGQLWVQNTPKILQK